MSGPGGSDTRYWRDVEDIFASVLDAEPARRREILEDRCGDRIELRAEVETLLASHDRAGEFIRPRTVSGPGLEPPSGQGALTGTRVGPFRLLEQIAEGGMGAVYRAERVEGDFAQQAAVKLIASRLHSADTLRRFRSERQILASLQHSNIVALLDGGLTPGGHPYLAMEYVSGLPLTEYCATNKTSLHERIRLFLQVCAAVRFAHRHLVVHRDLKPANVLVTREGVVKVLDFGIAKLLQEDGAPVEGTGLLLGPLTADYASPEQLRGGTVSTASDVYSLGVVLYELLSGTRPYRTTGRALDDVLKVVVHEEPPRPSAAGSPDLPYAASGLKGDLDSILSKAMAKDPERRYPTVEDLAHDLQRFLDGRPVKAQPESRSYVVGKFLNRHRPAALATLAAVVAVLAGLGVSLWQGRVARQERDRATAQLRKAQQTAQFLGGIFEKANPVSARGQTVTARDLLDAGALSIDTELKDQPEVKADLLVVMARAYDRLGQRPKALELGDQALALRRSTVASDEALAESLLLVGRMNRRLGRAAEAIPILKEALQKYEIAVGPESRPVAQCARDLGLALHARGQNDEAKTHLRRAIAIEEREAPDSASLGLFWSNLGSILASSGEERGARTAFERSIQVYERSNEPDSWGIAMPLLSFGDLLRSQEEFARARPLFEKALVVDNETFGEENGSSAYTLGRLGDLALADGKLEEARDLLDRSLKMWLKAEPASPGVPQTRRFIGRLLIAEGRPREARAVLEQVLAAWEGSLGREHPDVATMLNDLAQAEYAIGGVSLSEPLLIRALAIQRKALAPKHPALVPTLTALGRNRLDQKQPLAARPLLEEAAAIARAALPEGHSERLKAEAFLRGIAGR